MNELKKTPLHGWHVKNGAKMGPFGEWEMPLWYSGANKEYRAVREKAGLFDVSHMKVVGIEGKDAEKFVQYMTTNDVSRLDTGDIKYTLVCVQGGGILEDTTVYKASDTNFFFVINASNVEKILVWFQTWQTLKSFQVTIGTQRNNAILALQGPCAEKILSKTFPRHHLPEKRYSFNYADMAGLPIFFSRTGYTGEDGFEIICPEILANIIWKTLLDAGKEFGILSCGLVARDMLRTEAGMRLYGNDIGYTMNPIEAGLEKYVSLEKDFIGKDAIEKALALKNSGGGRNFHGFAMETKFFPEHGCLIFATEGIGAPEEFGIVTSATYSPSLKKRILMGYTREKMNPGETAWVKIGEDYRPATVTALPFYSRKKK